MIKGVNKRIVEVSLPESIYFEKAVVFLRAESCPRDEAALENEARSSIARLEYGLPPSDISAAKIKARIAAGRALNFLFRLSVIACGAAAVIPLIK